MKTIEVKTRRHTRASRGIRARKARAPVFRKNAYDWTFEENRKLVKARYS
jgi:hypothetical protein